MKAAPQKRTSKPAIRISKEVKKAISRFIKRTEKIVRSVSPQATIVVPKPPTAEKKPRTASVHSRKCEGKAEIPTPQFRGTALDR